LHSCYSILEITFIMIIDGVFVLEKSCHEFHE
jgi:hypothetical protein